MFVLPTIVILSPLFMNQVFAGCYYLCDNVVGPDVHEAFSFMAIKDPTNGTVFVIHRLCTYSLKFILFNPAIMSMSLPPGAKVLYQPPVIVLPYALTTQRNCPRTALEEILSELDPTRIILHTSPCLFFSRLDAEFRMLTFIRFDIHHMPGACG
jgi:hypothetical protein